ncbi:MAG: hypothetical protein WC587_01650 [Candidatus Paceibacterota bacterium]
MVKLIVLETDTTEENLFFNLVSRGRWDRPYYFSVDNYDWSKGVVTFSMLCCSPSPVMKVGIAGNLIVTSEKCIEELKDWLKEWGVQSRKKMTRSFLEPAKAQTFHKKLREEVSEKERQKAGERVAKRIKSFLSAVDEDLLAMCR